MIKIISGLVLVGLAFLGSVYFRNYHGSVIPYPFLWRILFILFGIIGVWLVYNGLTSERKAENNIQQEAFERFKAQSYRITIDFDRCEFKSGSYEHWVSEGNMAPLTALAFGHVAGLNRKDVKENVINSYLVYTDTTGDVPTKYISQHFPVDSKTLGFYVLSGKLELYVDRQDHTRYTFSLKEIT